MTESTSSTLTEAMSVATAGLRRHRASRVQTRPCACQNRPVTRIPLQVLCQRNGAGISAPGVSLEAFQANCLEIDGEVRLQRPRRDKIAGRRKLGCFEGCRRDERGSSREQLVQDSAQCIDVRGRTNPFRVSTRLLRHM